MVDDDGDGEVEEEDGEDEKSESLLVGLLTGHLGVPRPSLPSRFTPHRAFQTALPRTHSRPLLAGRSAYTDTPSRDDHNEQTRAQETAQEQHRTSQNSQGGGGPARIRPEQRRFGCVWGAPGAGAGDSRRIRRAQPPATFFSPTTSTRLPAAPTPSTATATPTATSPAKTTWMTVRLQHPRPRRRGLRRGRCEPPPPATSLFLVEYASCSASVFSPPVLDLCSIFTMLQSSQLAEGHTPIHQRRVARRLRTRRQHPSVCQRSSLRCSCTACPTGWQLSSFIQQSPFPSFLVFLGRPHDSSSQLSVSAHRPSPLRHDIDPDVFTMFPYTLFHLKLQRGSLKTWLLLPTVAVSAFPLMTRP